MSYKLNLGVWGSVFAVPSCVVDNYIKIAGGEHIKVLLYMLKNPDVVLRTEDISAMTGVSADEVEEAFIFWKNVGVISENNGEITPMVGKAEVSAPAVAKAPVSDITAARAKLNSHTQFPPVEIAKTVKRDDAFRCLCETFERLAGRPTKHVERNILMIITDEIGLPSEVALMLVEYSFSINKATPAYMKTVALDWIECGIDTIPKAEERIAVLTARHTLENRLRSKFQLNSAFSKTQKEYIESWAEAGFSDELIDEAYDATLIGAGKLSFPYMDKILKSWQDKGITEPGQIVKEKPAGASAPSFDVDDLEKSAYERYRKKQ